MDFRFQSQKINKQVFNLFHSIFFKTRGILNYNKSATKNKTKNELKKKEDTIDMFVGCSFG